jgi:hypothetical protein
VQGGATLAAALRRHDAVFGALIPAMAAAGEESGALDRAMATLADHLDEANDLRGQVRSALVYPAIMAGASAAGITVLLAFVVPRFTAMLQETGGTLPLSTRVPRGREPRRHHVVVAVAPARARSDRRGARLAWRRREPASLPRCPVAVASCRSDRDVVLDRAVHPSAWHAARERDAGARGAAHRARYGVEPRVGSRASIARPKM